MSLIQVPASWIKSTKIQEGRMLRLARTALKILFLVLPVPHSILLIPLKAALMPKTAPIHPNNVAVWRKLNQGPIIQSYLQLLSGQLWYLVQAMKLSTQSISVNKSSPEKMIRTKVTRRQMKSSQQNTYFLASVLRMVTFLMSSVTRLLLATTIINMRVLMTRLIAMLIKYIVPRMQFKNSIPNVTRAQAATIPIFTAIDFDCLFWFASLYFFL